MGTDRKKIILFDMDMTLVDSSIAKQYGKNYKEVQKHISEFAVFDGIKEVIEQLSEQHIIYVVSGNVGSTIKKVIQYFNLNIPLENVYGYRQGYPMENLSRAFVIRLSRSSSHSSWNSSTVSALVSDEQSISFKDIILKSLLSYFAINSSGTWLLI